MTLICGILGPAACGGPSSPATGDAASPASADNEALARALGAYRPFLLRLTGGFSHGPCPGTAPPHCEPLPADPPVTRALDRLNREIRSSRFSTRGPGTNSIGHRNAVWRLVIRPDLLTIQEAIADLEQDLANDPPNAADLYNDLAVAHGALSELDERYHGYHRFQALAAAADAVHADPDHPEALFNLALLQAEMGLRSTAAETWRHFLEIEPDPGWRSEAQEHLAEVEKPREIDAWTGQDLEAAAAARDRDEVQRLVELSPIQARTHLQQELFPAWGDAHLAGDLQAAEAARAKLAMIVPILTETVKDWEAADNLTIIDADPANPEANRRRRALASGLVGLRELKDLPDGCPEERYQRLERAREALTEAGGGSAAWAGWGLGICLQFRQQVAEACDLLQATADRMDSGRYPIATAYLLRQWSLDAELIGGLDQALKIYPLAIQLSTAERATAHSIQTLHASLLQRLGLEREVWNLQYALIRGLEDLPNNTATASLLGDTATLLKANGHPVAALPYQDQELHHLARSGVPSWGAFAHLARAWILEAAGDWDSATEDVEAGREYARQEGDEHRQARLVRLLEETEARLLLDKDPASALEKLSRAEAEGRWQGDREELVKTLLLLAKLHRQRGDLTALEACLREVVAIQKDLFGGIEDPWERRVALRSVWPQQRELATLLIEAQGDHEAAFELLDAARSRSLLEEIGALPARSVRDLQSQLAADTALVHFLVTEEVTYTWVVKAGALEFVRLDLPAGEVRYLENAVSRSMSTASPASLDETLVLLADVHDRLLRPLLPALDGVENLVFVTWDGLEMLPFAVLVDRERGHYLVEDFVPARAATASTALVLSERRMKAGAWQPRSVLAVGNPTFNRSIYPFLPPLPDAEEEAQQVARLYGAMPALLGPAASVGVLRRQLKEADLFHFAGHALAGTEPALLLATDPNDPSGMLLGHDLQTLSMPRLRLVVLSACDTAAAGAAADTEGLVRPFWVAGADAVVASLWKVNDEATRILMLRFHEHLQSGVAPALALASAQRSMLNETEDPLDRPSAWGAFAILGDGF